MEGRVEADKGVKKEGKDLLGWSNVKFRWCG